MVHNNNTSDGNMGGGGAIDDRLLGAKAMASALPGEEIVISGFAGSFPNSKNMQEFSDNLFGKVDMVLPISRWEFKHPEIPLRMGALPDIDKFDTGFFGVHERQSHSIDTTGRIFQEKAVEAILDAGLHPSDLENTKTGVFVGTCFSESEKSWFYENLRPETYAFTGAARSMLAHRLSYFLKLKGPSYITDTACSSSAFAFEHAFRALRLGEIDTAIIGGLNMCFHPYVSLQYARLGVLSKDGSCKSFDKLANGYARAETVAAIILQKMKDAKRVYGEVIYTKTNCDGYKEHGITFPSGAAQKALLGEFYEECDIDRYSLSFLEAHGTGTFVGDPEECIAIDDSLTEGRKMPLLMGTVKSNIGHSESASAVCSIAKSIIAMETGFIPPNIHYTTPRDGLKGLIEGKIKVVTEKMPFQDNRGLVGINNFGFGGGNCHILLRWNTKEKINNGLPEDNLSRLVCVSGRTEEAVTSLLDEITHNVFDAEHIQLLHNAFRKSIRNHLYRGYVIVSKRGEIARSSKHPPESYEYRPLYFAFGELNNWYDVGSHLMDLPVFVDSIRRTQKHLQSKDINLLDILLNKPSNISINHVIGSVAVQIGIIDILRLLEIKATSSFGWSFGELVSAYYDGILTLEEALRCALVINESLNKVNDEFHTKGNQVHYNVNNIHVADDNYIAKEELENLKLALKTNKSAFVKEYLFQNMTNILGNLKNGNLANKQLRSADYFINALTENNIQNLKHNNLSSVILNIGSVPRHSDVEDMVVLSFPNSEHRNYFAELLKTIGSLYEEGCNPQVSKLYPPIDLPVSRGTRMISPFIRWRHNRTTFFPQHNMVLKNQAQEGARVVSVHLTDSEMSYINGHVLDGRNLFPATGYLFMVWETYAIIGEAPLSAVNVVFENCKFIRATNMPKKGYLRFNITIQKGSGNFEIAEGESLSVVVTGRIYELKDSEYETSDSCDDSGLSKHDVLPLTTKDVYKELRLRGYNYKGGFRGIQECNNDASKAYIKWDENWVTFIDNMLQMKILQADTRLLYVPTYFAKLTISANKHLEYVSKHREAENNSNLPVFNDQTTGVIRCGGIYISGIIPSSIARKKDLATPVLESYQFIPNFATLDTQDSIRINIQIILENTLVYKVKAVELVDEFTKKDSVALTPVIRSVIEDQPLIQPFVKILSKLSLDVSVEVEDKPLTSETDCLLVIASNLLERSETLKEAFMSLTENGFIISRESQDFDMSRNIYPDISIITMHRTPSETLLLLQKQTEMKQSHYIKINSSDSFSWVPEIQSVTKTYPNDDIIIYSDSEPNSGILGLVNCLRREPDGRNIKCVFVMDTVNEINTKNHYVDQLKKNMAINIYKNGQWGTYRHLLLNISKGVESEHCFVNVTVRGDLSSLKWIEGPLRHNMVVPLEREFIDVYYAALNFRDVMTATGKINADVVTRVRLEQECVQGFEFSGRDKRGNRVMGMVTYGALSSVILADPYLTFKIPDSWTMEEAATVPVVYGTLIYGMLVRGQLKRGETVLIHSGSGGVGQAAIQLALHYECRVYTTVGTQDKRDFLKTTYPQLKDRHIGNSRDESFEEMIHRETSGRGVDMIVNSLTEDKLLASIRCLAKGGRFIEIGKVDMASNSYLNLLLFQKEASFHGIMLDQLFTESPSVKQEISNIIEELKLGAIKPLSKTTFKFDEIEQAFRFMTTGKHKGKVLVEIRKEEEELIFVPPVQKFPGIARYFCDPEKVYIIVGGLGGFGLELSDWLVLRGARKLVLTSRKGLSTGYQAYRSRIWISYGVQVKISKADVTTADGCKKLIDESLNLGPVDAIFNLAVVLADAIFENQTPESFLTSFKPKAIATHYLDKVTREMCPELREFVVFSSVSCGRGNAGQTNYGMANSVMERICEKRKQDGYPALAIQWGAVGEVGLVADMQEEHKELEISGTLQQRISNCLQVLDILLRQKEAPIVSSMVVAEKRGGAQTADNIVDSVINILGLNDLKSISIHSTLAELGMDSMTAVEIKQTLEREYDVFLPAKDIRTITLAKLKEIQTEKCEPSRSEDNKNFYFGIEIIINRLLGNATESSAPCVRLKSNVDEDSTSPKILLFPGMEGVAKVFDLFAARLNAHAVCIQLVDDYQGKAIEDMAKSVMPYVEEHVSENRTFNIVGYSFGGLIALEVVNILESKGYVGKVICIDSAPLLMKKLLRDLSTKSNEVLETFLICHLLSFYTSLEVISQHKESLFKCGSWNERLELGLSITKDAATLEEKYIRTVANRIYQSLQAMLVYTPSFSKLKSDIILCKPKDVGVQGLPEDYNLSLIFEKPVEVQVFEGKHVTILENEMLAKTIDAYINERDQERT